MADVCQLAVNGGLVQAGDHEIAVVNQRKQIQQLTEGLSLHEHGFSVSGEIIEAELTPQVTVIGNVGGYQITPLFHRTVTHATVRAISRTLSRVAKESLVPLDEEKKFAGKFP